MSPHRVPRSAIARRLQLGTLLSLGLLAAGAAPSGAQTRPPTSRDTVTKMEIYGFGQADMIFDGRRIDPNWFDVVRPTKLPSFGSEFNANGNTYVSVRQSRFGAKARTPTDHGDMFAQFEFDMFGVGIDAGQTTIRLRLAYGQWGKFGAGQLWSPFMDIDVFPNILDYWGPNGMIFFRNVMMFWQPIDRGETRLTFALERPGASGDLGRAAERIDLLNIQPRFPYPDLSGGFRLGWKYGHVKLAGILRDIRWNQIPTDTFDLSGHVTGWGGSLSSVTRLRKDKDVLRLQVNYGEGIQNYFNDAPVDVGAELNFLNVRIPVAGEALPIFGAVAYVDHTWNTHFTSSFGWSMVNITNSDLQLPRAFHNGQYASANLLWAPVKNVMIGGELQYSSRANFSDDFAFDDYRVQFSGKYSFSKIFGGKP
jgi:DcaP outer membrane protein